MYIARYDILEKREVVQDILVSIVWIYNVSQEFDVGFNFVLLKFIFIFQENVAWKRSLFFVFWIVRFKWPISILYWKLCIYNKHWQQR